MEWNGRPLGNKSAEDVHDIIQETSGDLQVELRVSRLVMGSATDPRVPLTAATDLRYPGGGAAGAGRPPVHSGAHQALRRRSWGCP